MLLHPGINVTQGIRGILLLILVLGPPKKKIGEGVVSLLFTELVPDHIAYTILTMKYVQTKTKGPWATLLNQKTLLVPFSKFIHIKLF